MQGEIKINTSKYPALLQQIEDPPKRFFYRGNYELEVFNKCVSVVGSRKMTRYGRDVTGEIVEVLVSLGVTVVSGFMYGVDAASHEFAVKYGGKTVAVMPCGIDLVHPSYQIGLYRDILSNGGLIISEYESNFPPAVWTYPRRNRIIAGLSEVTIIVEAGEDSGSLITADYANKFQRKVLAVPGSIFSPVSIGTNKLLSKYGEVLSSMSVLAEIFENSMDISSKKMMRTLERDEKSLMNVISDEPISMDDLSIKMGMDIRSLTMKISILQLDGFIREEAGKLYAN